MGAPFVCVGPAGVEITHWERLVHWVALVFVYFPHDDDLDVGKRVCLVQVREVFERQVLMEILHDVGVEG